MPASAFCDPVPSFQRAPHAMARTGSSLSHHLYSLLPQSPGKRPFPRPVTWPAHCLVQLRPQDGWLPSPQPCLSAHQSPPPGAGSCVRAFHPIRCSWPGQCHRNALSPQLPSTNHSQRMEPPVRAPGLLSTSLTTLLGWVSGCNNYCTIWSECLCPPTPKFTCGNSNS